MRNDYFPSILRIVLGFFFFLLGNFSFALPNPLLLWPHLSGLTYANPRVGIYVMYAA